MSYSNLPDGVTDWDIDRAFGGEEPDPDWIEDWVESNGDEVLDRLKDATSIALVIQWLRRLVGYEHDYHRVAEWWSEKYAFDVPYKDEAELFNEAKDICSNDPDQYKKDLFELYFESKAFDRFSQDEVLKEAEEAYFRQEDDFDEPFECDEGFAFARY